MLLYFDTGSHRSHLFHGLAEGGSERRIPRAGHVQIGCLDLALDSWRHRAEPPFDGVQVVATLGSDFVAEHAVEIDLRAQRLVQRPANAPVDEGPEWTHLPVTSVKGILIATVTIDGKPTRLSVDTGAWNLQLLDPDLVVPGGPHDASVSVVHDVFGNEVRFVRGTALLGLGGGEPRVVPVSRTRAFPAFERQRAELGDAMDGLLGLSALGASRIVFDVPRGEIRLAR